MISTALRLLLIDDNDLDAMKTVRAVEAMRLPHTILRARDGLEALEQMRSDAGLTLAFLDLKMPRMDGFEFLTAREAEPAFRRVPVFVLSTSTRQTDIDRCHQFSISGYLVKPSSVPEMLETVTVAIRLALRCSLPRQVGETLADQQMAAR